MRRRKLICEVWERHRIDERVTDDLLALLFTLRFSLFDFAPMSSLLLFEGLVCLVLYSKRLVTI